MPLNPVPEHRVLIWKWTKTATGDGLWYKPNMQGYTEDVTQAGLYNRAEAEKHVRGRGSDEVEVVTYGSDRMKGLLSRIHSMALRAYDLCETLCEREAERDAALKEVQELEVKYAKVISWHNKLVDERDFWQKLAGDNADKGREYKDRVEELEGGAQELAREVGPVPSIDPPWPFLEHARKTAWALAEQATIRFFSHSFSPYAMLALANMLNDLLNTVEEMNQKVFDLAEGKLSGVLRDLPAWEEMEFQLKAARQKVADAEHLRERESIALMELQEKYNGLDQAFAREAEHGRNRRARIRELEALSETLKRRMLKALGLGEGDMGQGWGWIESAVGELRNRKLLKDANAPVVAEEASRE